MKANHRNYARLLPVAACFLLSTVGQTASADDPSDRGRIVVANRTSGTISVIDVASDAVVKTLSIAIPGARPPQPMYVNYAPTLKRIFVSDRNNRYVAAFDDKTFDLLDTAPLGQGAFHMWTDPKGKQLWSVNDMDKSLSIIKPKNFQTLSTKPIPDDLIAAGGKPHDIALDPTGRLALVTVIGVPGKGYVLRYDTKRRVVTHRAEVGIDPHVGIAWKKPVVYVACQGSNKVYVLSTKDLSPVRDPIDVPGAHGTGMKHNDKTFYTTNLPGGGKDGLVAVDVATNAIVGKTDTGPAGAIEDVPHNIAITANDSKLYLTHSGHGEGESKGVVTVYDVRDDRQPRFLKKIPVGLDPFGIAYVPLK